MVQSVARLADHSAALLASSTLQLLSSICPFGVDAADEALQASDHHRGSQELAHHAECVTCSQHSMYIERDSRVSGITNGQRRPLCRNLMLLVDESQRSVLCVCGLTFTQPASTPCFCSICSCWKAGEPWRRCAEHCGCRPR